ncbi:MAG: hypothetical protein H6618_01290 [Deltaproteobacteria bacterium]|nr:hypothetical protein [Deltaproteobacteria bacterium]
MKELNFSFILVAKDGNHKYLVKKQLESMKNDDLEVYDKTDKSGLKHVAICQNSTNLKSVMHDKDFEPQNVKQRVSIMLDSDIITAARNQAQSRGTRCQTLINEVLRQILIDGNSANKEVLELARSITDGIAALAESRSVEERLNRIEEKLDNLSVKVS